MKTAGNQSIGGVWPVMLTPFADSGRIDYTALRRLMEWYEKRGAAGLFAVCQSSEMFFLSLRERIELAAFVKKHAGVPVVASGHMSNDIDDQADELRRIADTGVDAVILITNRLAEEGGSPDTAYYRRVTENPYILPNGKTVVYNPKTLEKWEALYRKQGMDGLMPHERSDSGQTRALDENAIAEIHRLKEKFPRINATLIYTKLIEDGAIKQQQVSLSSIQRFIKQNNLKSAVNPNQKDRKSFEEEHPCGMFQADTSYTCYIKEKTNRDGRNPVRCKFLWYIMLTANVYQTKYCLYVFLSIIYKEVRK